MTASAADPIDAVASPAPASGRPRRRATTAGTRATPIRRQIRLVRTFAARDLKSRFKGTSIGWIWSLVLPLATVVTYSVVFSVFIRVEPPPYGNGNPGAYAVFLLCGIVTWGAISNGVLTGIPSLLGSGSLMQKIYLAPHVPVLASVSTVLLQSGIELGIVLAVLAVVGNAGWTWLLIPLWVALLAPAIAATAVILAVVNVYLRDTMHIVAVLLQLLFFLSPVIYPLTLVPEDIRGIPVRAIVSANPITQFVEIGRDLLYSHSLPGLGSVAYVTTCTLGALVCARLVYRRYGQDVAEYM